MVRIFKVPYKHTYLIKTNLWPCSSTTETKIAQPFHYFKTKHFLLFFNKRSSRQPVAKATISKKLGTKSTLPKRDYIMNNQCLTKPVPKLIVINVQPSTATQSLQQTLSSAALTLQAVSNSLSNSVVNLDHTDAINMDGSTRRSKRTTKKSPRLLEAEETNKMIKIRRKSKESEEESTTASTSKSSKISTSSIPPEDPSSKKRKTNGSADVSVQAKTSTLDLDQSSSDSKDQDQNVLNPSKDIEDTIEDDCPVSEFLSKFLKKFSYFKTI